MTWGLQRICQHAHIRFCRPAQRNAYQYRTVAVAPANVGRCFLMRNQTKIGSRICITESRNGRSQLHHARNGLTGCFRECPIFQHLVLPVLHDTHMYMQSGTGFSCRDFRCKSNVISILASQITNNPFCYHQLVSSLLGTHRQEFYFILLINLIVQRKITDFRMPILYLSACLRNI